MSKIIDLDFTIHNIEGDVVEEKKVIKENGKAVLDGKGEEETEKVPLTLRGILMVLIPVFPKKERMVDIWDLGLRIKKSEAMGEFDKDEFSLIREVVDTNAFPNPVPGGKDTIDRYFPFIIAQTLKYLDSVEDKKTEEKGEEKTPGAEEGK